MSEGSALVVPPERRARCAGHPKEASETTCRGCGLFLCARCAGEGEPRCVGCRAEGHPVAWEDPKVGRLTAFGRTLKAVGRPNRFYTEVPWTGGLKGPLYFAVLAATIGAVGKAVTMFLLGIFVGSDTFLGLLQSVYGSFPGMSSGQGRAFLHEQLPQLLGTLHHALLNMILSQTLTAPLEAVFELFVMAALTHPVARWLGGRGNFEATFRALAYASAAQVIKLIPFLGLPLAVFGGLLVVVVGLRRAHGLTGGRALIATLWWIPIALLLFLLLMFWMGAMMLRVALGAG